LNQADTTRQFLTRCEPRHTLGRGKRLARACGCANDAHEFASSPWV